MEIMKKYKILIVGCGELGSRHLQAVASLSDIDEVDIVDLRQEAIELGKSRLAEISDTNADIKFRWFLELDKRSSGGDLCIIASRAKVRPVLLKQVFKTLNYRYFLLEKVVAQSVEEYEDLLSFCKDNKIAAWVNCKSRAYGIHKYIKTKVEPNEPFIFCRIAGNHGLVSNGIHGADLFVFYAQCRIMNFINARIDNIPHPSKRGGDIYDLSGTLTGLSDKGSEFIISFAANHTSPDYISIVSPKGRFFIDHTQQFFLESYPDANWEWKQINLAKENWAVSHMTKAFANDILAKGKCDLPTLEECFPAHKFILETLQPQFKRLLNKNLDYCPVT